MAFSTIGTLSVNVVANTQRLAQGLARSTSLVKGFTAAATAALAGRAFIQSLTRAAEEIDSIGKAAERLGESTEHMVGLIHASELAGLSQERLAAGVTRLTRNISEANQGLGEAQLAIQTLGLRAESLNRLKPAEQLGKIADALRGIENQADKVQLTEKLFGRGGSEFLNLLKEGSAGLQQMQKDAEALGLTFSEDVSKNVQEMNDNIDRMKGLMRGFGRRALGAIAKPVAASADFFAEAGSRGEGYLNTGSSFDNFMAAAGEFFAYLRLQPRGQMRPLLRRSSVTQGLDPLEMQRRLADRISESRQALLTPITKQITGSVSTGSGKVWESLAKLGDGLDNLSRKGFMGRTMQVFGGAGGGAPRSGGDPFLARLLIAAFPFLVQGATGLGLKGLSTIGQRQRMPLAALERGTVEAFTASRANLDDVPKKQLKVQERIEGGIKELVGIVREKMPEFIVKSIPGI